ncbi:MAG: hypothetical protein D8M58_04095 [Calditrichaeota bacterium]|nr:MAG: hypothetical protein DWQ03_02980 [Calditrichota bacterium]MBL1204550.1 hypothetical protein [Calditrichota bacterium]NOG44378.1 hypothetical protein [Calditrichota bacterium]
MTSNKKNNIVGNSWLVPFVESFIRTLSHLSVYHIIVKWKRKNGKWPDDELIRFAFVETYVISYPTILFLLFLLSNCYCLSYLLYMAAGIAIYRLFDLLHGHFSILIFEMQRKRKDENGHYILVRHSVRWFLLLLINLIDITLCFSVVYLTFGFLFTPEISSRIDALYQVFGTFTTIAGSVSSPMGIYGKLLVIFHLIYLIIMFVIVLPIIISTIRGKEVTTEVFGTEAGQDKRYDKKS